MVVSKIFGGVCDEEVHSDFLKFGRGEYRNRYLLEAKRQKDSWIVKTGNEFVNFLVRRCLEKIKGEISVNGLIVSTSDLRDELPFEVEKVSNFQGMRKTFVDARVDARALLEIVVKHPRVFFAFNFSGEDFSLKIKQKAPKSGKPGKESDEGPKANFCTLKTRDGALIRELFFDVENFREVSANHRIVVENIVYPENLKRLKPAEVRELSKRQGVLYRTCVVDRVVKESSVKFIA